MGLSKLINIIVGRFFLLILIIRLATLFGLPFNLMRIYQILSLMVGVICLFRVKFRGFDLLVLLYLIYIFINS